MTDYSKWDKKVKCINGAEYAGLETNKVYTVAHTLYDYVDYKGVRHTKPAYILTTGWPYAWDIDRFDSVS